MANAVFCIANSQSQAVRIVSELKLAGFIDNDISVLLPDKSGTREFAHEQHTKAPEGAATGAGAGGVLGGLVGVLAGIGTLAIPGIGPFVAAGPILAALSGVGIGAAVGGVTGALIGMGIPELEAKLYESKLRDGNVLISAHAATNDRLRRAKDIFQACGATDIVTGSEKAAPKKADRRSSGEMQP